MYLGWKFRFYNWFSGTKIKRLFEIGIL